MSQNYLPLQNISAGETTSSAVFLKAALFAVLIHVAFAASSAFAGVDTVDPNATAESHVRALQAIKTAQANLCPNREPKPKVPSSEASAPCIDCLNSPAAKGAGQLAQQISSLNTSVTKADRIAQVELEVAYYESIQPRTGGRAVLDPTSAQERLDENKKYFEIGKETALLNEKLITQKTALKNLMKQLSENPSSVSSELLAAASAVVEKQSVFDKYANDHAKKRLEQSEKFIENLKKMTSVPATDLKYHESRLPALAKGVEYTKSVMDKSASLRQFLKTRDRRHLTSEVRDYYDNLIKHQITSAEMADVNWNKEAKSYRENIQAAERELSAIAEYKRVEKENSGKGTPAADFAIREAKLKALEMAYSGIEHEATRNPGFNRCGLSPAELHSIIDYSASGYSILNEAIRKGKLETSGLQPFADVLKRALSKLNPYLGDVRRGAKLPIAVLEKHREGEIVPYESFTSTSLESGFSGDHQFVIRSKNGRYIGSFSSSYDEHEVLFAPNTRFKILSRKESKGKIEFVMEEVE